MTPVLVVFQERHLSDISCGMVCLCYTLITVAPWKQLKIIFDTVEMSSVSLPIHLYIHHYNLVFQILEFLARASVHIN